MKLIINADDFGYTPGTSLAICDLAKTGAITSTTVMANLPSAAEAVRLLKYPNLGIGLHFNLTEGRPLCDPNDIPGLVDADGYFAGQSSIQARARQAQINPEEVYKELSAQYYQLYGIVGDRLDHLDSHQGVNKNCVVNQALLRFGKLNRIPAIRVYKKYYLHNTAIQYTIRHPRLYDVRTFGIKRVIVESILRYRTRHLARHFRHPDGLLVATSHRAIDVLKALTTIDTLALPRNLVLEVAFHPSVDTDGLDNSRLTEQRVEEYQYCMSRSFLDAVQKLTLVNFSALRSEQYIS